MGESKTIFGLHYEYIEKNGQYLVVKEKQEQALTEEDLIQLQLRMMQSNQIPNLLPLSVEEIDFELKSILKRLIARFPLNVRVQIS